MNVEHTLLLEFTYLLRCEIRVYREFHYSATELIALNVRISFIATVKYEKKYYFPAFLLLFMQYLHPTDNEQAHGRFLTLWPFSDFATASFWT